MKYCYQNNGTGWHSVDDDYTAQTGEVLFDHEPTATELSAAFSGYAAAVKSQKLTELNAWLETSKSTVRNSISDLYLADGTSATMDSKLSSLQTKYNTLLSSYNTKLAVIKNG